MASGNLENLVRIGKPKAEPGSQSEFDGLVASARSRFADAKNTSLAIESRFDLAYNASHAFALAALRWHGYRPDGRYLVFQCLPYTVGLAPEIWRIFDECHRRRNAAEYEGILEIEEQLISDLLDALEFLAARVAEFAPVPRAGKR